MSIERIVKAAVEWNERRQQREAVRVMGKVIVGLPLTVYRYSGEVANAKTVILPTPIDGER